MSNQSATTTVSSSGTSNLVTNGTTTGGTAIIIKGTNATQSVADSNGNITNITGTDTESTAALTLTDGVGNVNGIVITETKAVMSGGEYSTSLTLNDNGATFSNSANGAPVQVHGVADGASDYDAVNYRQLKEVRDRDYSGIASLAALAAIPDPI